MTKPYPIAIQLYSLREEAAKDFRHVLERVAEMGYQGVETAGLHDLSAEEFRRIVDDLGLTVCSSHGPRPRGDVSETVDMLRTIGSSRYVSSGGRDQFGNAEARSAFSAELERIAERFAAARIEFGYHNHDWEFMPETPEVSTHPPTPAGTVDQSPYAEVLRSAPSVYCQIDTYWVEVAGLSVAQTIRQFGDRVRQLHVKDGPAERGPAMTAVGSGKMNWEPIIEAADENGSVEWLIVELDKCDTDMFEAVENSLRYLVETGYAQKR